MASPIFRLEARADLEDITSYIRRDNPQAALALIHDIVARCRLLAETPLIGRDRSTSFGEGVRTVVFRKYLVIYRPTASGIEVIRIVHAARNLPSA